MLAAVTVTNATDLTNADTSSITALIANNGGDGISLREAVEASNNTAGEDRITFDGNVFTGGTNSLIRLVQGELEITDGLSIDASNATDVVISGDANGNGFHDDDSRVINFSDPSGDLTLSQLTITGGDATNDDPVSYTHLTLPTIYSV